MSHRLEAIKAIAKRDVKRELETSRERRRYALLQAAAEIAQWDDHCDALDVETSVNCAEALLEEIEKREKEGQS